MAQGDGLDQRQPQANATITFGRAGQTIKRLKNAFAQVRWYTWALVADPDDGMPGGLAETQGDGAGGMAMRIFQQVAHGAAQQLSHPLHRQGRIPRC